MPKKFNGKAKEFTDAYIDCYLSLEDACDACDLTIKTGKKLLKDKRVRAYLQAQLKEYRLSPEEYIRHLEMIAFGDIQELFEDEEGEMKPNQLKRFSKIPLHLRRQIKKFKAVLTTTGNVTYSVELVSREKAIELLYKILCAQNDENEGQSGGAILIPVTDLATWNKEAFKQQKTMQKQGVQR